MGDRVLVLNKGVVHQLGTPTEVYDHPADTFVAAFLGSPPMNLVELAEHIVGFRPEHLRPASSVTGDAVSLRLRVENIEYLGAEWIVSGSVGGGRLDGKKVFSRLTSAQGLALEGTYDFAVPQRELRFFDRATEKRAAPMDLMLARATAMTRPSARRVFQWNDRRISARVAARQNRRCPRAPGLALM